MFVEMGTIVRAVGLRGELKLLPTADFDEGILASCFLRRWAEGRGPRPAVLQRHRWKGTVVVLKLEGVDDRDAAESLVGEQLGFLEQDFGREDFPRPAQPMPFLYCDLEVWTEEGERVGRVEEVLAYSANWVLRVQGEDAEFLIPVIPPVIRTLEREAGRLTIHALPGLLGDADEA